MKNIYFLIFALLFTFCIHAQGIYQFWGVTEYGGSNGIGTIFSTSATGDNFQQRHDFKISNPGAQPMYSELVEYNGKFYSMTNQGGFLSGSGVIFEWDPATNTYTKKVDFFNDGTAPNGSLALYNGKFYGMTERGGNSSNPGVIFEWDPATNVYIKKFVLGAVLGKNPKGSLVSYNGKFYGMTELGGINGLGVIFEWDPVTNIYNKKIDFDGSNGSSPVGNLCLKSGKFYGMTKKGGINSKGVIFEWDPVTNTYTKKIDLVDINGSFPYGSLTENGGSFYGMTSSGGINGLGVIFEWDPVSNNYIKKYDFDGTNGSSPYGNLSLDNGRLYGMTNSGGLDNKGVMFEWDPGTNTFAIKKYFSDLDGNKPYGSLSLKNGKFYSMTYRGGSNDNGVIFELDPASNTFTKKIDFNGSDGQHAGGNLIMNNGKVYGTTGSGGIFGKGVIFEWDPAGNAYSKKIDFNFIDGGYPLAGMTSYNGRYYGMTPRSTTEMGVIFEWDPVSNNYIKKYDFDGTNGSSPEGDLVLNNGKFYGLTLYGGSNDMGVIFEWDPASNVYTKKIDFSAGNGSYPFGNLSLHNGKFYGLTLYGGSNDKGVIFEWDPATNVYTKKINFNGSNGSYPFGSLCLYNGKFYGLTNGLEGQNGSTSKGVIFEWDPATNVCIKKYDFNGIDGQGPQGSLSLSNNGKLYGMTRYGGSNQAGVIFEWDPVANQYTKKFEFSYSTGMQPYKDITLLPAPVAKGIPNNCVSFLPVTIDNSNNNTWVPVVDDKGDAVAEIKANGNNLGVVNASMYINNNSVREDVANKLYLDRNITLTPQFPLPPGSTADVRLYIKNSEYLALKNAVSSTGQPSGINSINDIGIYKNTDDCLPAIGHIANPVASTRNPWEADHVLSANISSFSTFYFANTTQGGPLPVTLLEFNGRLLNNRDAAINWKTTDEFNLHSFDLERSIDGRTYTPIANIYAVNQLGIHQYNYTDKNIVSLGVPVIYYRLKQKDLDGKFSYSDIVALNIKNGLIVLLYPNPVSNDVNLSININKTEELQVRLIDNAGRVVKQQPWNLSAGNNSLTIDVKNLANGIYYLEMQSETIHEHKRFIKQ